MVPNSQKKRKKNNPQQGVAHQEEAVAHQEEAVDQVALSGVHQEEGPAALSEAALQEEVQAVLSGAHRVEVHQAVLSEEVHQAVLSEAVHQVVQNVARLDDYINPNRETSNAIAVSIRIVPITASTR